MNIVVGGGDKFTGVGSYCQLAGGSGDTWNIKIFQLYAQNILGEWIAVYQAEGVVYHHHQ